MLHGSYTYVLQTEDGLISNTHSVSAGLDYAAVGPEHAELHRRGRVEYTHVNDQEALEAASLLARVEGIIPAPTSASRRRSPGPAKSVRRPGSLHRSSSTRAGVSASAPARRPQRFSVRAMIVQKLGSSW